MRNYFSLNLMGLGLLILSGLVGSCGGPETDNAQVQADISPIIPKVPGTVQEVRVRDNQRVEQGDTLVLLDARDFQLRVQQAEIGLAQAEANVIVARQGRQAADQGTLAVTNNSAAATAGIEAARAGVQTARVRLRQAQQSLDRQQQLLSQESTTQQAYDNVLAERDAAAAGLAAAEAQVRVLTQQAAAARQQVSSTRTEAATAATAIGLAELAVRQAQAALATARLQASYTALLAPTAGIVSDKNVQIGQVVSPGQTLLKVADDSCLWVVANFKETQLEGMQVGQPVEIKADAYDQKFEGKIESFAAATGARFSLLPPDNATGNFVKVTQRIPVRIAFTEAPKRTNAPLRAGMSVTVEVKRP